MIGLSISRTKDSYFMLPPETQMQLMEGSWAFIDKYRKAGKCKEIYNVPLLKMSVSIWEVESPEETDRIILENPFYPFMDIEVYTLSNWDAYTKASKEVYQQRLAKK